MSDSEIEMAMIAIGILFIVGIGTLIYNKIIEEPKKREKKREKEKREKEQVRVNQQTYYHNKLVNTTKQALDTYAALANHLEVAEKYLDQAMADYTERAYSPFWDSIERAAKALAWYDEDVRFIKRSISDYIDLKAKYGKTAPGYPIAKESLSKLDTATETANKMSNIVRTAQRDFEFSTIYEQRKTNQILIAGFTSLADALYGMTQEITDALDDMNSTLRTIDDRLIGINSTLSAQFKQQGEFIDEYGEATAERAIREKKVLERLDNIQRNRQPAVKKRK